MQTKRLQTRHKTVINQSQNGYQSGTKRMQNIRRKYVTTRVETGRKIGYEPVTNRSKNRSQNRPQTG